MKKKAMLILVAAVLFVALAGMMLCRVRVDGIRAGTPGKPEKITIG